MRVFSTLAAILVVAGCSNNGTGGPQSSDATLAAMSVSTGALTPLFSPSTTAYAVTVPSTTTSLTVTAFTANTNATLRVNNAVVPSGQPSPAIILDVGTNLVSVSVVAEDNTQKQYTITVTR